MSEFYLFSLPYPPSANRYWRMNKRRGYLHVSREAELYKRQAADAARLQGVRMLSGDLSVLVDVTRPIKARDLDNNMKVTLDALNGIAWQDDKQIIDLHFRQFDDKQRPGLMVLVKQVTHNEKETLIHGYKKT